jgi:hypothetical protein
MKHLREAVKGKRPNLRREKNGCSNKTTLLHILSPQINRDMLIKHIQTCPTTPVLTKSPMNRSLLVTKVQIRTERWNIESDDIQENSQIKLCAF